MAFQQNFRQACALQRNCQKNNTSKLETQVTKGLKTSMKARYKLFKKIIKTKNTQ